MTTNALQQQLFRKPIIWAIFVAVLFHVAGAIGIVFFDRNFFVEQTPLNLMIMFLLLLWTEARISKPFLLSLLVAFFTGLFTEMIGVHTGWLFGSYAYQAVMGLQLMDVPLLIGINWFFVVYSSFILASRYSQQLGASTWLMALVTAMLATAFDWFMEPVAMELGFWKWENNQVPVYNYLCWFLISFALARVFVLLKTPSTNLFSIFLLLIQTVFFLFLRLAL